MKELRWRVVPYRLALRAPVATARARASLRAGWWIEVRDEQGASGWGEVACWPGFGAGRGLAAARLAHLTVDARRRPLEGLDPAAVHRWSATWANAPEVRAGVEGALLDLAARRSGLPLAALLAEAPFEQVPAQALVDSPAEARAATEAGVTAVKVKVGRGAPAEDLGRVLAVREAVGPAVAVVCDAGGAWSPEEAARTCEALASAGADRVEQPTAPADLPAAAWVRARSPIPVWLDEGVRDAIDLERAVALAAADGLVVKPTAVGGVASARALLDRARAAGWRVALSHLLETTIGRTAALHLACAARLADPCGLTPVLAREGRPRGPLTLPRSAPPAEVPFAPGLGVTPPGAALQEVSS